MSSENKVRDASRIEADLARNRDALEATVDKLQHKFTPSEIFDQAWRYASASSADGTTSRMKDSVVRNPLPVALIGLGVAWLLMSGRQGSVPSQRSAGDRVSAPETSAPSPHPHTVTPVSTEPVSAEPVSTDKPRRAAGPVEPPPAPSARSTPARHTEAKPTPARAASAGAQRASPPDSPASRP